MANYVFGANLIENLTTGMYQNPLVIFREYIQNSCDAIDKARADEILAADEGSIEITIDKDARRITIEDNGTGIPVLDFKPTLTSIAASDKNLESNRGFRGIGRLCGVAYCKELRFTSTAKDEVVQSTMIINAENMCKKFYGKEKIKAEDLLDESINFPKVSVADPDEHFFRVELIDIVDTNNDLLDKEKVREYLSFVAPVDYKNSLGFKGLQNKILEHAAKLNFKIAGYKILVDGEHLYKPYKSNFKTTHNGADEIFDIDFRDFYDDEKNLIAWSWIGLSKFKGVIDQTSGTPDNLMRGIRLRAGNIQIGDQEALKHLFSEARGTNYFIGEVHAVDKNLIPNGRRDYFVENKACNTFEGELRKYFDELYKIYHAASDIRGFQKRISAPAEAVQDFQQGRSIFKNQAELNSELAKLNKIATTAENKIESVRKEAEQNPDSALSRVVLRMTENKIPPPVNMIRNKRKQKQNNFRPFIGAKI
ncbi:MAG: ATP-binding protein [Selenomonadaceae bacterium]|nr:ATP-binding protein [Selenomonadaceae bacterium]